ncbi:N-acetylmuramoyl-L-alanine amidase [Bacteroidia bacterium]|nr:N-acetylmuramoyl-L-alanine amidase [Bacteroidia bacterium]
MTSNVKCLLIAILLIINTLSVYGDPRKDFVYKYRALAVREMHRTGIPASIKLAQGILESGSGFSDLAVKANNHFGIKCHGSWKGARHYQDDDEENECFRHYERPEESWIDHSNFLLNRPWYAPLFELERTDYKGWAKGLKSIGYATNPEYAKLLISIIEEEQLYVYDTVTPKKKETEQVSEKVEGKLDNYRIREETRNKLLCIEAKEGDTYENIALYYGIDVDKLLSFNDKLDNTITPGDCIYLQKKRTKALEGYEVHEVKAGDTMYSISQYYGIRLDNLQRNNYHLAGMKLIEGDKVSLR